ncbi:MAG: right-handed parallel beta-helix repeat-containing protein [Bacteroidetes bacterium]|jgi:parallel beta-helix repeat protein|nr:right-handed parallel beta-helix repeat-containing protein [Bacteroidota bacterium]MDF1867374.1 right-handed parallel beta-helix repeat-containing protein [Saprospiraceae bacterium]
MKLSPFTTGILSALILLLVSCQPEVKGPQTLDPNTLVKDFQRRLIEAKAGEQILLPAGTFNFKRSISLNDIPDVTIKGAGKGKTILSFKSQIEGAEGMLIKNVKGITLEGFTIADSKGDAIKVQGCENVVFRDVETTWTNGKLATNGAYGLYPVSSKNILLEKCEASYAMDAGIYVGQSQNVVVRDNYVHHNVAGLEIENTINGEVYNNVAKENTGGMLIFDMPDLPQANGDRIKFYNNVMENNNGENFAPKGMVVSTIPPGSGMIIMSHSNIEAYNNTITNHKTLGIAVNSWLFTGVPFKSEAFDPFCSNISLHDNIISGNVGPCDNTSDYGQLLTAIAGGEPVDLLTDGIFKPTSMDENGNPIGYCFRNNGTDIKFLNLNAGMGGEPEQIAKNMDNDLSKFDCELPDFDTSEHDKWLAAK